MVVVLMVAFPVVSGQRAGVGVVVLLTSDDTHDDVINIKLLHISTIMYDARPLHFFLFRVVVVRSSHRIPESLLSIISSWTDSPDMPVMTEMTASWANIVILFMCQT